jgi:hypothetical protein
MWQPNAHPQRVPHATILGFDMMIPGMRSL